ncbi:histidine phosphatase family protein [Catellatospora sp. NPDC049133]|jgi:probable phosphoglycerate mutase|uniref:histidine phosphatase family protein n=1 Tax=Catellatospora sp. NPDC049133 TaxID=3155499 RepID=UPI0033DBB0FD
MTGNRLLYLVRHGEADALGELTEAGLEQARLTGERLASVPFASVQHSPVRRAAHTAALITAHLPGVPVEQSPLAGDYVPYLPPDDELPAFAKGFLDGYSPAEIAEGAALIEAAQARYTAVAETDTHELVVTHNFLIGWLVRHALDAPPARWIGINQANCGITVLLYRAGRPPSLVSFNDLAHLPERLRWTGFPPTLHV